MTSKTQVKNAARKLKASTPHDTGKAPAPYVLSASVSTALAGLVDSGVNKYGAALDELSAFSAFVNSIDWTSAQCFDKSVDTLGELCITSGIPSQGIKYVTMLRNCWKIAHGGKKGDVTVQGYGVAHLLGLFADTFDSINALSKALSDGKPDALKPQGATRGTSAKVKSKPAITQAGNIVTVKGEADALKAAAQIMAMVVSFLKPSDYALVDAYNKCLALTQSRIATEPKPLLKAA